MSVRRLIQSDFARFYEIASVKNIVKALFNPCIHASVLIRLATNTHSKLFYVVCRNILIFKHSIDVGYNTVIGEGLLLPHPFCIVIGDEVIIGNNATIYHSTTFGFKSGYPVIKNDVTVYCGSVIVGDIVVGDHSVVGAMSFLDKSLPSHSKFYRK